MIQDIFPDCLNNHYEEQTPAPHHKVLFFRGEKLMVHVGEGTVFDYPVFEEFPAAWQTVYLFSVSEEPYFLAVEPETDRTKTLPDCFLGGYGWYTLRELRALPRHDSRDLFIAYTGYHLWKWYETSRFCGVCGAKTIHSRKERAKECPVCKNVIYPRINPAVIVGVRNGDRLLLTRYKTGYAHNALVAGFTEIGETVEETVRREVMEEVGLKVKNLTYYKSQPWGVALDILMGFYCDVDGDDRIRRDEGELKYAEWVPRGEIVLQPTDDSLTNEMMKRFRDGKDPQQKKR